jgi:Uncharacterised nucleotidyltransferase
MGTHLHMDDTGHAVALPPLATVAAALRDVTEVLAREITSPTDQPPLWDGFEWRVAQAVASMQGVSSLLCDGLRWKGPASWQRFLEEQREHVVGRHRKIVQLLDRIDSLSRREGIALVALKGAALHASGIYRAGERPMADIDLLAHEVDVKATSRLLEDCGFELTFTTWRNLLFESRLRRVSTAGDLGENINSPIKIELHTSIRERLPIRESEITQFVFPRAAHPGLNAYPSVASLMMHLLLHAAGNMRSHALRLIQLHDIALLSARFGPCDWDELLIARPNGRAPWWAVPPLILTARYYPGTIPAYVIDRLGAQCPWLLDWVARRQLLADVSWSDIRVNALPGIEWSRTPQEALRFVISRIWPSHDDRFELQHFAEHHPGASEVPWYGISQAARILRWVFSKPPRVQTILSIRAALAQRRDEAGSRAA